MLTDRFDRAMLFASGKHREQKRKGTTVPYFSHVLAVTALVLEHGGTEEQAIAALLHDTVEDCGGPPVLEEIRQQFGDQTARMVEALSDAAPLPGQGKPPWKERKQTYLDHLPILPPDTMLVCLCDKLHNARSILSDMDAVGLAVFDRFKGGLEGTVWYYRSLADVFGKSLPGPAARRLDAVVAEIETACRAG